MKTASAWKSIALAAILQFACYPAFSEGWVKDLTSLGIDHSPQVVQTNDGGYLLGTKKDGHTFLIKTNATGNVIWTKFFDNLPGWGGPATQDIVQQTSDSGYILVITNGSVIVKLNAGGDIQWTQSFDGYPYQVKETPEHGYIVLAASKWTGNEGIMLVKFSETGTLAWSKIINRQDYTLNGWSLDVLSDGGYIVGGERIPSDTLIANYGGFIARMNSTGDTLWTKFVGNEYCIIQYIQVTASGYLCGGQYYDGVNSGRAFLTDTVGSFIWAFENGCIAQSGFVFDETADNAVVVVGKENNTICKVNSAGDLIWTKNLGVYGRSLRQTSDGGFILTADNNVAISGSGSYYLIKTDANGDTSATTSMQTINTLQAGLTITPNPFEGMLHLDCTIAKSGNVKIEMLNVLGESVAVLKDDFVAEGNHTFTFQTDIPSGIYFARIISQENQAIQKIIRR